MSPAKALASVFDGFCTLRCAVQQLHVCSDLYSASPFNFGSSGCERAKQKSRVHQKRELFPVKNVEKNEKRSLSSFLSLIFHRDLAKLQNFGAFQNWKSQKYFEIELPSRKIEKLEEKNPRQTLLFMSNKSISVFQNRHKFRHRICPDLKEESEQLSHKHKVPLLHR